ncbi:hypothetical protein L5515_005265 [Caenorhabditis briggsae]|uniref:Uncharacterized protein n=1 Tax=Caenorhabditis briggsae TaxID=6238 RepID=A0AAE9EQ12_CAEBR|nr:hypothetical protein L5515_005265 [Caenorhabditis briggsae]
MNEDELVDICTFLKCDPSNPLDPNSESNGPCYFPNPCSSEPYTGPPFPREKVLEELKTRSLEGYIEHCLLSGDQQMLECLRTTVIHSHLFLEFPVFHLSKLLANPVVSSELSPAFVLKFFFYTMLLSAQGLR